jgi:hypothetical protein
MLKILIANDGYHAHYFERIAWYSAFNDIPGITASFYDCKQSAAFDVFEIEKPDIFIGQAYNLDSATIKCIKNRPWLKVALRVGDWGDLDVDSRFNILRATEQEIRTLENLKKESLQPEFVFCHYLPEDIQVTHRKFNNIGIRAVSMMLAANVHAYYMSQYDPDLACDIAFVGGYWPYKGVIMDAMLVPLCEQIGKYNIKIFGNQPWPHVNQYCGHIDESNVANLFKSAKICPNLSEPHAHVYGVEINERSFKVLLAGGFCIGDAVASHKKIFKDGMVFADSPGDFNNKIDYYLNSPEERIKIAAQGRQIVIKEHTNFHRVAQFLREFGYNDLADKATNIVKDLK